MDIKFKFYYDILWYYCDLCRKQHTATIVNIFSNVLILLDIFIEQKIGKTKVKPTILAALTAFGGF